MDSAPSFTILRSSKACHAWFYRQLAGGYSQNHLHILWGISVPDNVQKATGEIEQDKKFSESDVSDSASELDSLKEEAEEAAEKAANAI